MRKLPTSLFNFLSTPTPPAHDFIPTIAGKVFKESTHLCQTVSLFFSYKHNPLSSTFVLGSSTSLATPATAHRRLGGISLSSCCNPGLSIRRQVRHSGKREFIFDSRASGVASSSRCRTWTTQAPAFRVSNPFSCVSCFVFHPTRLIFYLFRIPILAPVPDLAL